MIGRAIVVPLYGGSSSGRGHVFYTQHFAAVDIRQLVITAVQALKPPFMIRRTVVIPLDRLPAVGRGHIGNADHHVAVYVLKLIYAAVFNRRLPTGRSRKLPIIEVK